VKAPLKIFLIIKNKIPTKSYTKNESNMIMNTATKVMEAMANISFTRTANIPILQLQGPVTR
jgi:hypothetical protein